MYKIYIMYVIYIIYTLYTIYAIYIYIDSCSLCDIVSCDLAKLIISLGVVFCLSVCFAGPLAFSMHTISKFGNRNSFNFSSPVYNVSFFFP